MKPRRVRRVTKHGKTVKPKFDPLPSPYALPLGPSSRERELESKLEAERDKRDALVDKVLDKSMGEEGEKGVIKIIQLLIVGIDPRTTFGKLFYIGVLIALILWIVNETGLI